MLPQSYDKVSEQTKQTVQLFIARASGFLQGKGQSDDDDEIHITMQGIQERALDEAVELAREVWRVGRKPCSAEELVQRFADLVWEAATGNEDRPWPYEFSAPVDEGPLATEFLEAIGITEEEVGGNPQLNKEQSTGNDQRIKKEKSPEEEVKLPLYPEPARKEPETLKTAILDTLDAEMVYASRSKRKYGDPDNTTSKRRRGNDGERLLSGSYTSLATGVQWSGIPLADYEFRLMNAGLMEDIWETKIYDGDNIYHDAGVFAVKVPKDKVWLLLGKDITRVFRLIGRRWHPLRLYTCDLGHFLQVGLWVEQSQSQGQMEEKVCCKSKELYHLLRHWAFQAQCDGMQSLANLLQGYLKHLGVR